ncbi:hypothetical protein FXO37_25481 [Capsicum annuum]|nr:hypothetical protein FXO37_25481 [Capsicum annuum]
MTFLVIPIKVDEASVKAQKGKQLVHKQFPFSFLLKSLSTLGKMQDKGKQVARTNKYLTKLFSNKVVIHMPQVLSEIGLECNGLETLCIKDQNFSVKRAEKVFGWALSHHLMRNTQADIDLRLVLSSNRIRHSRCLAFSNALPPMGINFYNCLAKVQKLESLSLTDNGSGSGRDKLDIRAQFMVPECLRNHVGDIGPRSWDVKSQGHAVHYSCAHVILLTISENSDLYQGMTPMGLYMLDSDSWRHCGSMDSTEHGFDSGVFWNGAIHWIGKYFSVDFVVSSEEVGRIELSHAPWGSCNQKFMYFGESGGHLRLI